MKYLAFLFFFLALIFSACSTIENAPNYVRAVDAVFADWDKNGPGGALGIVRNGQLEYAKGYGLANLEHDIPNSPQSVFRIASTSKQFTASCIVLLSEEGKLSLDDPLSKYFPELPDYADHINIRHLLNHTSGLRDYLQLSILSGLSDDDFYTDEELMQWFVNQKGYNFPAGEEFLYCNTGYWLLGQIVEQVSGLNMAEYAEKNIFEPLGMENTHFHNDNKRIVKKRASGYAPTDNGYRINMTQLEMIGDGAIFTSIEDMAKWDHNFYTKKVGSETFHQTLQTPAILNNGDTLPYAMGLVNRVYKGLKTVEHGGAFVGFRANFVRFPEKNTTLIIFSNRADANPNALSEEVADILFDLDSEEESPEELEEEKEEIITLSSAEMEPLVGHYWDAEESVSREVKLSNNELYLDGSMLQAIGPQKFIGQWRDLKTIVSFEGSGMVVDLPGFTRWEHEKYEPSVYTPKELERFAGNYFSEELGVSYGIQQENNHLILYVDNQKISPLVPFSGTQFNNQRFGLLDFDKEGTKASSFSLTKGRVMNLYFERMD